MTMHYHVHYDHHAYHRQAHYHQGGEQDHDHEPADLTDLSSRWYEPPDLADPWRPFEPLAQPE